MKLFSYIIVAFFAFISGFLFAAFIIASKERYIVRDQGQKNEGCAKHECLRDTEISTEG